MGQKIDRTYLFERMPVGQAVRRQIIPSIASQMVILLYNLADTYFVGLLNDAAQTAAVSLAYSVTLLMTALANLFAVGGAGRIAQLLGRRDRDGAREVCAVSFWFALLASAAFCVLFTLLSSPILRLCGATDETYALACGYSRWVISVGGTFSILNTVLANLIRADGSAFAASMGVSAGGIINMLLDPLFVLPLLAYLEESEDIDGVLFLLNTVGGDVEAGLAIAELISGMKKPTVSLVLGGGHSIGVPLAVAPMVTMIAPSASMTIHPVRTSGTIIAAPQTYQYFERLQERIVRFVTKNSRIGRDEFLRLMMDTQDLASDVGSVLYGEEAVACGLIQRLGSLSDALDALYRLIDEKKK